MKIGPGAHHVESSLYALKSMSQMSKTNMLKPSGRSVLGKSTENQR